MYASCYITAKNLKEAEKIAKHLLEKRLIGCANVFSSVKSFFWWSDKKEASKIVEDNEVVVICKTKLEFKDKITKEVKKVHSYTTPCVVFWEIKGGNEDYLNWLESELGK